MLTYQASFDPDRKAGGYVVTFPDLDLGATQGDTLKEAVEMAEDLLTCMVRHLIGDGETLPAPAKHRGKHYRPVSLPALQSAKAELYMAFHSSGMKKAELARRVGMSKTNVDRLFDLDHASKLDHIEAAFHALGKRLEVNVANAA